MLPKPFYNDFNISIVVFPQFKVDKYIIKIYNHEVVNKSKEYFINISLEYYQSINKTKRYYKIFKIIIFSLKSSLLLITFLNIDLIIYILKIKFNKLDGFYKLV